MFEMISLITCSIKPDICRRMLDSVSSTIGIEYETIVYDNREKNNGICKAYNEAASNATGDYLCFVHEDIEIKTKNWGKDLIEFVSDNPDCGVIGLAGGYYAPRNFSGWGVDLKAISVKIFNPVSSDNREWTCHYFNPYEDVFSKVICIDGLFLFVKREIWQENKFDERIQGFHFYDLDFSFAIAQKYQNYVYFGMDVYHYSGGSKDKTYCENMYEFQKKWKNNLPYFLPGYEVSFREEVRQAGEVFFLYRNNGLSMVETFKRIININGFLFFICFFIEKSKKTFLKKIKI